MNNPADKLHNLRHSLAHILASAVLEMFPKAQLGVGPVIENGFYYDFKLPRPITPEDLKKLEKRMRELVKQKLDFQRQELSTSDAKKFFEDKNQPFKIELINDIETHGTTKMDEILTDSPSPGEGRDTGRGRTDEDVVVSLYTTGKFVDLCRGGHVENTSEIDSKGFTLDKVSGAYWRGDQANPQMQRIYGLAFETKDALDAYLAMVAEAEKRDHKKLGPQLDLFTFSELVGSGLPLWTPKGTLVRNILDDFVWQLRKTRGYQRVEIPHITKKDLYEQSGHWDKFKDELFRITTREGHEFAMKPMNCPHHTQIYNRKQHSYRELPQRYANTTMVYRDEQTGELSGLSRVRSITQDDAHVFCRPAQVKEEILKIWDVIEEFYRAIGFNELQIRLSFHDPAHPEKYLGTPQLWQQAEESLTQLVKEKGVDALIAPGEAAFYGPKIDFLAKDSLGREWQVATIQLDMNMPERFNLNYVTEEGKDERVVMIHAAIMGSIERCMSIIIEHHAGAFPLWMAPVQVALLTISDKYIEYAQAVRTQLQQAILDLRIELDDRDESIGKKIREATLQKIPYQIILGEKEIEAKTVAVRTREGTDLGTMSLEKFVEKIVAEIAQKK